MREAGVVERALVLGDPDDAAAEVGDQRLARAPRVPRVAVTPKTQPGSRARSTSVPVKSSPGASRAPRRRRRRPGPSTARPCLPEVCTTCWPGRIAPEAASIVTTLASMSSGTVSSSRSQDRDDGGRLVDANAREQRLDAGARRGGLAGDGDDLVACGAECGREDGADPAGADNPDTGHGLITFRSSPHEEVPDGVLMRAPTSVRAAGNRPEPAPGVGSVTALRHAPRPAAAVAWRDDLAGHARGAAADLAPDLEAGVGRGAVRRRRLLPPGGAGGALPHLRARLAAVRARRWCG